MTTCLSTTGRFALVLSLGAALACGADDPGGESPPEGGGASGGSSGEGGSGAGAAGDPSSGGDSGGGGLVSPENLGPLVINEAMAKNDGAWIDEYWEADDWVELLNRSDASLALSDYFVEDANGQRVQLPSLNLDPGQSVLVWVDSDPSQGALHLPFKLSSVGDRLLISDADGNAVDGVEIPSLDENEAYARFPDGQGDFQRCRYATPGAANGPTCTTTDAPSLLDDVTYESAQIPSPYPAAPQGLAVDELALRPDSGGAFVELANHGGEAISLDDYLVEIAAHRPSQVWPEAFEGVDVPLPSGAALAPGERLAVDVPAEALADLEADPAFEGVVTLFEVDSQTATERVDFMQWPVGATLTREASSPGRLRLCENSSRGTAGECVPLTSRDVGERVRHLRTEGDFDALARGDTQLGIQSAKFVMDLANPGLVHLLSAERWALHYTFVRERVYEEPALDRCDDEQAAEFYAGWSDFSSREYDSVDDRRFHMGTLSLHGGAGLRTFEYTFGDVITAEQMRDAFLEVAGHLIDPERWSIRPQDDEQTDKLRAVEGQVPIVGPNAPFANLTYQPLTEGVAYGTLEFIPARELLTRNPGAGVIVVTDDVPNDIPFVGGLITEAFQTPLAHVNVLSQNRGTPNAGLKNAREVLAEHLGKLVRLEVTPAGLVVEPASPEEAAAFRESQDPGGGPISPRLDESVRGPQDLTEHGLDSLPIIGAKAAQMAELTELVLDQALDEPYECQGVRPFEIPEAPFAIPLVHSREHFAASGAAQLLAELEADPSFASDPEARAAGLARVRALILEHPVEASLLAEIESELDARWGDVRVRFRSSSNTEDLPGFNGAGLYTSLSARLSDDTRRVDDAMRTVWASLWNVRAYDERAFARIDGANLGMGILVHPAFLAERGNGVSVSRNVLDPTRGDIYYLNAQLGEASVTNPAPAVSTEQLIYRWDYEPAISYQSRSSILRALPEPPELVLTPEEVLQVACATWLVHDHFFARLPEAGEDPWFAMETEFKLIGPERRLLLKQARPHSFGTERVSADCREL